MAENRFQTSVEEDQTAAQDRRAKGEFVRGISGFRYAEDDIDFPAVPNRYHFLVAFNCPWHHRVRLARNILGVQHRITLDILFPNQTGEEDPAGPNLWQFAPERSATLTGEPLPACTAETGNVQSYRLIRDIYAAESSNERSVPIRYDKQNRRSVSNESAEIIRMLNQFLVSLDSGLNKVERLNLYPQDPKLRAEIEVLNERIYLAINNGAYKAGFSSDQAIYAQAFRLYFATLDHLDDLLSNRRPFLTGVSFTEAGLRLFPTLYRHDPVYYVRMKVNGGQILDYPYLWRWLCRVYALDGVESAGLLIHCKQGYFGRSWNGVVPIGPTLPMPYPEAYVHPELVSLGHLVKHFCVRASGFSYKFYSIQKFCV